MRNYLSSVALLTVLLGAELNVFFLKYAGRREVLLTCAGSCSGCRATTRWCQSASRSSSPGRSQRRESTTRSVKRLGRLTLIPQYVSHSRRIVRMGSHAAMLLSTVALELLCIVKVRRASSDSSDIFSGVRAS